MGVKPIFRLTAASGRSIRATGNHPYLTRPGWRKAVEIKVGEDIAAPAGTAQGIDSNSSSPTINNFSARQSSQALWEAGEGGRRLFSARQSSQALWEAGEGGRR
ncbi:MAG: hypothetical protein HY922_02850, partial [Elusimicrobia bacterium]|nr:hypothetical protein [Elusimicrobiota bacterium]